MYALDLVPPPCLGEEGLQHVDLETKQGDQSSGRNV